MGGGEVARGGERVGIGESHRRAVPALATRLRVGRPPGVETPIRHHHQRAGRGRCRRREKGSAHAGAGPIGRGRDGERSHNPRRPRRRARHAPGAARAMTTLAARAAYAGAALFVALIVLFSMLGAAQPSTPLLITMGAIGAASHLVLLPVVAAMPTPEWARAAGYGCLVVDTMLN